jgi:hypothetical protein
MTTFSSRIAALMVKFFKGAGIKSDRCSRLFGNRTKVSSMLIQEHPIIIPSASLNSREFEALAGRRVITANQACLWYAVRLIGIPAQFEGAGKIFKIAICYPGIKVNDCAMTGCRC